MASLGGKSVMLQLIGDMLKDTLLIDVEEKKRKKPRTQRDLNPQPI